MAQLAMTLQRWKAWVVPGRRGLVQGKIFDRQLDNNDDGEPADDDAAEMTEDARGREVGLARRTR